MANENKIIKTYANMIRADVQPATLNEEKRTVEVVFATDTPVLTSGRVSNWEPFKEVLSFDNAHVRMDRLNNGAPVLDNHDRYGGVRTVLGVVENPTIDPVTRTGKATLRFSKRSEVEGIFQDVKDGILKNVSVGYRVYKYEMQPSVEGETVRTYKAIDWEPTEISLANIPADPNSGMRTEGAEQFDTEIIEQNQNRGLEPNMTEAEKKALRDAERQRAADITKAVAEAGLSAEFARGLIDNEAVTVEAARTAITAEKERVSNDPNKAREEGAKAERQRAADIIKAVKAAKLNDEFARTLIEEGATIEAARERIIAEFEKNDPFKGSRSATPTVGEDRGEEFRRTATEAALVLRAEPSKASKAGYKEEVIAEAKKFRHMTLLDLAKDALERGGVRTEGMSKMEIVGRAFTSSSSDFGVLLEGTNRRILLANYNEAADTWRQFCSVGSVSDFREYKRLRMGTFSDLEEVSENGEFKTKKITDADFEKISAKTKGNIINVSRQMIINDDLGAFTRLAAMLGRAAARSIENDVYALLALNSGLGPVMVDGKTLIHADHNNIAATAGAPTVVILDGMRQTMARHMDKDSNDYLDIRPSLALSPLSLGSTLRILNGSQYDPDANNKLQRPNIVNGLLNQVIDTPRLSGNAYYLFADPNVEPVIEVVFLDGNQTPYMESKTGFTVDGVEWKIREDYGVGAIGYRGIIRNAG